jgi:hydroxymethylpyrimidine kinase/phosphomethylpyrimidine kinase/thiamine-phosphate diphosphorylase
MNFITTNDTQKALEPFFFIKNDALGTPTAVAAEPGVPGTEWTQATLLLATPAQAQALLKDDRPRAAPDLATALRQRGVGSVLVLGEPQTADAGLRTHDWMDTPHASGWLSRPATDTERLAHTAAQALAHGFVPADALVLARMHTASGHGWPQAWPPTDAPALGLNIAHLPRLSLPGHALPTPPLFPPLPALDDAHRTLGLYPVVDSADWVERVLAAGVRTVQLRIKDPAQPDLRQHIRRSVAAARAASAQLYINDHWQLALEEGAFGVHLGQEDLGHADVQAIAQAGLHLGLSTHSPWEVSRAWALRPSYIACGPIHATTTKDMPWRPQGNGNLAFWSHLLPVPVVAIGGMDVQRLQEAVQHGAAGVALITAITASAHPEQALAQLQAAWAQGLRAPRTLAPGWPRTTR